MSSKKPKFSFVTLFLLTEIEPIFFKYQPKIGISISSFFKINRGELKLFEGKKFQTLIDVKLL